VGAARAAPVRRKPLRRPGKPRHRRPRHVRVEEGALDKAAAVALDRRTWTSTACLIQTLPQPTAAANTRARAAAGVTQQVVVAEAVAWAVARLTRLPSGRS
jgi:hypothetical protein